MYRAALLFLSIIWCSPDAPAKISAKRLFPHWDEILRFYDFRTLEKSGVLQIRPKILPYEKCRIYADRKIAKNTRISGAADVDQAHYVLLCSSRRLHLAYKIPVTLTLDEEEGFSLAKGKSGRKFFLRGLDGVKARAIAGQYSGFQQQIHIGYSIGYDRLTRKLEDQTGRIELAPSGSRRRGISFGFHRIELAFRPLTEHERHSPTYNRLVDLGHTLDAQLMDRTDRLDFHWLEHLIPLEYTPAVKLPDESDDAYAERMKVDLDRAYAERQAAVLEMEFRKVTDKTIALWRKETALPAAQKPS